MKHLSLLLVIVCTGIALILPGCGDDADSMLVVRNESTVTIWSIYISAVGDSEWGPDRLSGDLPPRTKVTFYVEEGIYDVKVVAPRNELLYEVDIGSGETATITIR